jgi:DNA-binding response OmpR family regulator
MDVQMPEMDGLQATREIRKQLSAEQLPIVAMTAHAMEEERRRCLDAGMNDHVSKPLDPAVLIATLRKWVTPHPNGTGAVTARPGAGAEPVTATPRLAAFNVPAALDRLGGDEELLRALILRFCAEFANAGTDLHEFIARRAYGDAQRLAHNLAGVASQLEATEVAASARSLEVTLRANEFDGIAALTERIGTALDGAFASAAALATSPETPA